MSRVALCLLLVLSACSTKKTCQVGGVTVDDGKTNPADACQVCDISKTQTAFTSLADGTACGVGRVCGSGTCTAGCFIDGAVHAPGADPSNACRVCVPSQSTHSWTSGDAGCSVTGCTIDGQHVEPFALNPSNACQSCQPARGDTVWSSHDGAACGVGAICSGGECEFRGCVIDGVTYPPGAWRPNNECQSCQPFWTTTTWTLVADGTSCGTGATCSAGACQAVSTGCTVGGASYAAGAGDPANPCRVCTPSVSTTAFTGVPDGASCGTGGTCVGGACSALTCSIGGVTYAAGAVYPGNPCLVCDPAQNRAQFSPTTGASCGQGKLCINGGCSSDCLIDGGIYAPNQIDPANPCAWCNPALSNMGWSTLEATGCGGANLCHDFACGPGCAINQAYVAPGTVNPGNPCQTCDPTSNTATWTVSAVGTSCGPNGLNCSVQGVCRVGCFIAGTEYASGAADPTHPCQVCDPTQSATAWSASADGASCGACSACTAGVCGPQPLDSTGTAPGGLYASATEVIYTDASGVLVRFALPGLQRTQWSGLDHPTGVTSNGLQQILVAEAGATGRISVFYPDGGSAPLVMPLVSPKAVDVQGSARVFWADKGSATQPGSVGTFNFGNGTGAAYTSTGAPSDLVVDGTSVYWIDGSNSTVNAAPIGGGTTVSIAAGGVPTSVGQDATHLLWTLENGAVLVANKPLHAGDSGTVFVGGLTGSVGPGDVVSDGTTFYWAKSDPSLTNGYVASLPLAGGTPGSIFHGGSPTHLAIGGQCLYFTVEGSAARLWRTNLVP